MTLVEELRQLADWVREAQDPNVPRHRKIDIGDIDDGLIDQAASVIEKGEAG